MGCGVPGLWCAARWSHLHQMWRAFYNLDLELPAFTLPPWPAVWEEYQGLIGLCLAATSCTTLGVLLGTESADALTAYALTAYALS